MKNLCRKYISAVISLILVASMAPVGFAADINNEELVTAPAESIIITEADMNQETIEEHVSASNVTVYSLSKKDNTVDLTMTSVGAADGSDYRIPCVRLGNDDKTKALDTLYGYAFSPEFTEDFIVDVNLMGEGTITSSDSRGLRWGTGKILHNLMKDVNSAKTDEYGFRNLRYIFEVNSEGYYVMTCLDMLNGEKQISKKATTYTSCPGIFCQQYLNAKNQNTGIYLYVSKFKVMRYIRPKVVSISEESLKRGAMELTAVLSDTVDESTLSDKSVVLKNKATGKAVLNTLKSYDSETRTIVLDMHEYLSQDTEYTISLDGVISDSGFASSADDVFIFKTAPLPTVVSDIKFCDSNGQQIISLGANKNISVTLNAESDDPEAGSLRVFLLLYDENDIVRDIQMETVILSSESQLVKVTLSENIEPKTGYKAKCFIWETTETNQRPVIEIPLELK